MTTPAEQLVATLRNATRAFAAGDQVAPCAVLWPDPARLWESVLPALLESMQELYVFGNYSPEARTGPALWLRCIEARVVAGFPPAGTTPIFYLPGISRDTLRAAEDCPVELAALVELQYRGTVWMHVNGKEWTPNAFLSAKQMYGGLDLDVAQDGPTQEALAGALAEVLGEPLDKLQGRRLDSEYFNRLVAPDATGLLLQWLNDPNGFKDRRATREWRAFCSQCKATFSFDPAKDGPLKGAKLLAGRGNPWSKVWSRFADNPRSYLGVVEWLKRAAPKNQEMSFTADVWPTVNEAEERKLDEGLKALVDRPQEDVIQGVLGLEALHGDRRAYPWQKLDQSPLATVLQPLSQLAILCQTAPGAPTADAYAEFYASEGWRVDAAALATMALCGSPEQHGAVLAAVRSMYLPWLDNVARHLQQLIQSNGQSVGKRTPKPVETGPGRLVLFADGLRMDVAQLLVQELAGFDIEATQSWEWSTIPSVTATAKPAASPIADLVKGGDAGVDFATRIGLSGAALTQPRFVAALKEENWQFLEQSETGDPTGAAWTEAGTLDKRGHHEGWKLARSVEGEVRDLASRIAALLNAGWSDVTVVTDHGWLLMPGGLPKVELKGYLTDTQWSRCAALKAGAQTDAQCFKWYWDPNVVMASPPGAGSYRAGIEYSHGGVSLQEMVTPTIRVKIARTSGRSAQLREAKWNGARCNVLVSGECRGVRIDVRTVQSDPSTSLLTDKLARETTSEGRVTLYLEDDANIGKDALIVLLDASKQVIDSQHTKIGT
jgi:hypothetical protein